MESVGAKARYPFRHAPRHPLKSVDIFFHMTDVGTLSALESVTRLSWHLHRSAPLFFCFIFAHPNGVRCIVEACFISSHPSALRVFPEKNASED